MKNSRPLRHGFSGSIIALMAFAGVIVGGTSASAATYAPWDYANVRSEPNTSSQILNVIPPGQAISIDCYVNGQAVGDVGSTIWNHLTSGGYMADFVLYTGTNDPVVPKCGEQPQPQAVSTDTRDDYPAQWKNGALDQYVDSWRLYSRECTSFAAFRLSSRNGHELTPMYGHAKEWGKHARQQGYAVDMNPRVGSIAWSAAGRYGHVAWVAAVNGDQVVVEEYNYEFEAAYGTRTLNKNDFSGYIHFKDIG